MAQSLNPYALLDVEDQDGDVPVAATTTTTSAAPAAANKAPAASSAAKNTSSNNKTSAAPAKGGAANAQQQQGRQMQKPRQEGNRDRPRGDRPTGARPPRREQEDAGAGDVAEKEHRQPDHDRPRRGGRGGYSGRKREFDRHSGTGRRDGEKKETVGTGNWGKAEVNADEVPVEKTEEELAAAAAAAEAKKEEDKTVTYTEWKEKQSELSDLAPKRQVSEDPRWKNSQELVKEDEEFFTGKGMKEKKGDKKTQGKEVKTIDFAPKPYTPERNERFERGTRGGRGGAGRSSGPARGSGRQQHASGSRPAPPPALTDESAFPSLS